MDRQQGKYPASVSIPYCMGDSKKHIKTEIKKPLILTEIVASRTQCHGNTKDTTP